MDKSTTLLSSENGTINVIELLEVIWAGKITIIVTTFVASVIAIALALSKPDIYRSEALLAPASTNESNLGDLASSFGGLASLTGIPLSSGGDKTTLGIEVLKSRAFFSEFIQTQDVLVPLMAAKGWDATTKELIINEKSYDINSNEWIREVKGPHKAEPSVQEAHKKFLQILTIVQNKETGLVTIAVEHYSPYIAKQWVDHLVESINETIKKHDVLRAERAINYLKDQISSTQLAVLQTGFFSMIEAQTETIMLANASPEYLFQTIDPAVVPELKIRPRRSIISVFGAITGGMFGVLFVLIRHFTIDGK